MILNSQRGVTLIELIIFIIVGGIFIPLVYVAFNSALQETSKPERMVKLRFIAQTKMEDLTRNAYGNLPPSSSYTLVKADTRFSDDSYNDYSWKWEYEDITYQDSADHSTTSILTAVDVPVIGSINYKLGDYVKLNAESNTFYRAHFLKWQKNTRYDVGNYIVPTTSDYVYPMKATISGTSSSSEPSFWLSDIGELVPDGRVTWTKIPFPILPPTHSWSVNTPYTFGNTIGSSFPFERYRCSTAGTSGVKEPEWDNNEEYDGLQWQVVNEAPTASLASVPPSPWPGGSEINVHENGNQVRWIESNVYKRITVNVRAPGCTTTDCEYKVSTIITSRTVP